MASRKPNLGPTAFRVLTHPKGPWNMKPKQRAAMTIASKDAELIPRVPEAGTTKTINGVEVQVMHNGLYVKKNGYQGTWQAETIDKLRGIHEPQEEKVFQAVVERLTSGAVIMELGSWWSYYSMWVLKDVPDSQAICCEPDHTNLELGRANGQLNGFKLDKQMIFYHCASGSKDGKYISFKDEDGSTEKVQIRSVDSIINERKLAKLDILHLDIQGAELDTLKGALGAIKDGKIRFVFVSTHHYLISGDPLMHQKCLDFLRRHGAHIVAKHTILESSSGDGLIVASFDNRDKDFQVHVSAQPTDESLFRSYEHDIDILWKSYDKLVKYTADVEEQLETVLRETEDRDRRLAELEQEFQEIGHLKDHIRRQIKRRIKTVNHKPKQ